MGLFGLGRNERERMELKSLEVAKRLLIEDESYRKIRDLSAQALKDVVSDVVETSYEGLREVEKGAKRVGLTMFDGHCIWVAEAALRHMKDFESEEKWREWRELKICFWCAGTGCGRCQK